VCFGVTLQFGRAAAWVAASAAPERPTATPSKTIIRDVRRTTAEGSRFRRRSAVDPRVDLVRN
jgi:hypothetical protein